MRRAWMLYALMLLLIAAVWGWQRLAPQAPAESSRPPTPALPAAAAPATTPRAAPVDPPPSAVLPQRAPPSVQIDDQQRLQTEADLPRWAAELEQRAERGDGDAAESLQQLLKQCSVRAEFESGAIPAELVWEVIAEGVGAERVPALQAEYAQLVHRCGRWRIWTRTCWPTASAVGRGAPPNSASRARACRWRRTRTRAAPPPPNCCKPIPRRWPARARRWAR
ncbi:MAG: hypothetical protein U1F26_16875 [Lysobacterales bacterium]